MLADNVVSMNVNYSKTHTYFMYVPTCTTDFYVFVWFGLVLFCFFFLQSRLGTSLSYSKVQLTKNQDCYLHSYLIILEVMLIFLSW